MIQSVFIPAAVYNQCSIPETQIKNVKNCV